MLKYEGREMSREYPDLVVGRYAIRWFFGLACIAAWVFFVNYFVS